MSRYIPNVRKIEFFNIKQCHYISILVARPNTDMDFPQKNVSSSQNPDNWVSSKKCPMAFPIEILEIILSYASLVTQLKFRSTCRFFHKTNDMEKCISDIKCKIDSCNYVLESTTITHIVTNIPFDICVQMKSFFHHRTVYPTQIPFCDLKYLPLSENFGCYQLSTPIKCTGFSLGFFPHSYYELPVLTIHSEINWGRPDILNELSFQPVHCSHLSGWCFPTNTPTTIAELTKDKSYTVIVCTSPLIFNIASS